PASVKAGVLASHSLASDEGGGSVTPSGPVAGLTLAPGTITIGDDGKGFRLDIHKLDFQANKEEFERQFLISALKAFTGRINQTALHANIPKKPLLRKLEKYGINARDDSANRGKTAFSGSGAPPWTACEAPSRTSGSLHRGGRPSHEAPLPNTP